MASDELMFSSFGRAIIHPHEEHLAGDDDDDHCDRNYDYGFCKSLYRSELSTFCKIFLVMKASHITITYYLVSNSKKYITVHSII
jgi:hypothetical protein